MRRKHTRNRVADLWRRDFPRCGDLWKHIVKLYPMDCKLPLGCGLKDYGYITFEKGVFYMANKATGLARIIKAAGYSYKGLTAAWQNEAAFRQESVAAVVAIILAIWLDVGAIARILLIGSVLLVMIIELLNSAIEAVVDRVGTDYHELSGRAKDMGSAAVSLTIVLALLVWGSVLWQHFS
ncbi:diacylglycerol kinase (modular protein) [Enterobacterales bacterium 8AC]|nr:diacylglycerol kinase (modular protein) [Enterobacterales bacterium 8AC]